MPDNSERWEFCLKHNRFPELHTCEFSGKTQWHFMIYERPLMTGALYRSAGSGATPTEAIDEAIKSTLVCNAG